MDTGDLLAVVGQSEAESEFRNSLGLGAGDNFERFDDTWNRLMFQSRVFSLGVLTDNAKINILMAGLVSGNVLDEDN